MGLGGDLDHEAYGLLGAAFWSRLDPSPTRRHVIDIDLDARPSHQDEPAAPYLEPGCPESDR
jgi:hypothetical protein